MEDGNLVSRLIDTYKFLNEKVRPVADTRLQALQTGGSSTEAIVRAMRNDELHFSQSLKERVSGVAVQSTRGKTDEPVIGAEAREESTAIMIAQFGSAREVTLALLRGLPDAAWDEAGDGGSTIRARVEELVARDQKSLSAITAHLGGVATA